MVLPDLSAKSIRGADAEAALATAGFTSNKNPIPFDVPRPADWSGLRLGVAAATPRGLGTEEMNLLGDCITQLIEAAANGTPADAAEAARPVVASICDRFPMA